MWREVMKENFIFVWLEDLSKPRSGLGPRPKGGRRCSGQWPEHGRSKFWP